MFQVTGNIWDFHGNKEYIGITTNGVISSLGRLIMGKGIAKEASLKYPDIPKILGKHVRENGNTVCILPSYKMFSFPTKHNWWENSLLDLIEDSCKGLVNSLEYYRVKKVYLPRPGCGNGNLDWKDVEPILSKYLDERFYIINEQ